MNDDESQYENESELEQVQNNLQEKKEETAFSKNLNTIYKATRDGKFKEIVNQKAMGYLVKLAPYIGWALIVIIIVIMIIGLVAYFLTMPGLMSNHMKEIGKSITSYFKNFIMIESAADIGKDDVIELAQYIEDMDYDLIGYGFVKPLQKDSNSENIAEELEKNGYTREEKVQYDDDNVIRNVRYLDKDGNPYDGEKYFFDTDGKKYDSSTGKALDEKDGSYKKYGIEYSAEENKIKSLEGVDSSLLRTYLISNRSIYILRNDDEHENIFKKMYTSLFEFFSNTNYSSWAKGLVKLYESKNYLATNAYSGRKIKYFGEDGKNLVIESDDLFSGKNMQYNTEGWTGRYGLSQDFLISLHLATLSPEFVQTVVQSFDTEVQVYLDEAVNAEAIVEVRDGTSTVIRDEGKGLRIADLTKSDKDEEPSRFEAIGINIDDNGLDFDAWWTSNSEAARFFAFLDMKSPNTCVNGYQIGLADRVTHNGGIIKDGENIGDGQLKYYNNIANTFENNVLPRTIGSDATNGLTDIEKKYDPESSYAVSTVVKYFVDNFDKYDFDKDDFYKKVHLSDDDDCATNKLIDNLNPIKDMGYFENLKSTILPTKKVKSSLEKNKNFFGNNTEIICVNSSKYYNSWNKQAALNDENIIFSEAFQIRNENGDNIDFSQIDIGQTCAYERGKWKLNDDKVELDYNTLFNNISLHNNSKKNNNEQNKNYSCQCEFCKTFWHKYLMIEDVGYEEGAIGEGVLERANKTFDSSKDLNNENDNSNGSIDYLDVEYIVDLYTWKPKNMDIEYHISFYKKGRNGNIEILVSRDWTDEEMEQKSEFIKATETCYKKITNKVDEEYENGYSGFLQDIADNKLSSEEIEKVLKECDNVKVCSQCRKYVNNIIKAMKKYNDNSFDIKVPYIARVVGSWFRDTYFVIPTIEDKAIKDLKKSGYDTDSLISKDIKVIENDEEFLEKTGELWTRYIMYNGDYANFILNKNGDLLTNKDDFTTYMLGINEKITENDKKFIIDRLLGITEEKKDYSEIWENIIDGTFNEEDYIYNNYFGLWKETEKYYLDDEEVENYDKQEKEILEKYNISLVKIPATKSFAQNNDYDIAWSAYSQAANGSVEWQPITEAEINEDSKLKTVYDKYPASKNKLVFSVGLGNVFNIEQVQEAERGMTNSKIKYLFKNKKYYKYDGSAARAFEIANDWRECVSNLTVKDVLVNNKVEDLLKGTVRNVFRPRIFSFFSGFEILTDVKDELQETALNTYIDNIYYQNDIDLSNYIDLKFARDFNGDGIADIASINLNEKTEYNGLEIDETTTFTNDPRNPNLISNIDLAADGLSAFAILENTHSADADYAYRDLKELLVELEYFDKEDLTEPAKDVLEWPLPESNSAGWPISPYDKRNDEYGATLHSRDMYNNFNELLGKATTEPKDKENEDNQDELKSENDDSNGNNDNKELEKNNDDKNKDDDEKEKTNTNSSPYEYINLNSDEKENKHCDSVVIVNGVEYRNYKQGYSDWADFSFGANDDSVMSGAGCGPTSCAILLSGYGIDIKPTETATYLTQNQNILPKQELNGLVGCLKANGVDATYEFTTDKSKLETLIRKAWSEGKPVIYNVTGKNPLSTYGHFIVLLGEKDGKEVIISDPYNYPATKGDDLFDPTNSGKNKRTPENDAEHINDVVYSSLKNSTTQTGLKGFLELCPSKGVAIPLNAPDGSIISNSDSNSSSTMVYVDPFEGFDKGDAIVSPATAKVIEMGTINVVNEGKDKFLKTLFVSDNPNDYQSTDGSKVSEENEEKSENEEIFDASQSIMVNSKQKEEIEIKCEEFEEDPDNPFGKTYTTGYIKLEIIGKETIDKLVKSDLLKDNPQAQEGLNAFYDDYYNKTQKKTICDSYTIYIQGIDYRIDQSGSWDDLNNTIMNEIITSQSDESKEDTEKGKITITNADGEELEKTIDNYTEKEIPKYYPRATRISMAEKETKKQKMPSIINFASNDEADASKRLLYIKAGTLLGVCGDANIKIVMKDKDYGVVENIEDYLEIEDFETGVYKNQSSSFNSDLNRFFFIPYEGGPIVDSPKIVVETGAPGRNETPGVAVGICQWTTHDGGDNVNNVEVLCKWLYEHDSELCSELKDFIGLNSSQIHSNINKIRNAFETIDNKSHERLLELEMQFKYEEIENYAKTRNVEWILDRTPSLWGTYASVVNWLPYQDYNNSTSIWERCLSESATDQDNIMNLMRAAIREGDLDTRWHSQARLAIDLLNGDCTEDDFNIWMTTKGACSEIGTRYGEENNNGYVK